MKIKTTTTTTEIECTAEELRMSNGIADGVRNMLRDLFNPVVYHVDADDEDKDEEEET